MTTTVPNGMLSFDGGACAIYLKNVSAGSLSEAIAINFAVIKAVTA
jgi:hypothetical protein